MKQLCNLALACAERPEVLMQIYNGTVSVHVGTGPERATLITRWDNDERILEMIHDLHFECYHEKWRNVAEGDGA